MGKGEVPLLRFRRLGSQLFWSVHRTCARAGESVEAICWKYLRKMNPLFEEEPINVGREELELDQVVFQK